MPFIFYNQDLIELIEQFYILTGIRIVLFDADGSEVISCPQNRIPLCAHMRKNPIFDRHCRECEKIYFKKCRKSLSLTVYKCHAGFIEAISPLTENGMIIGYVMFGQITDNKNKAEFIKDISALCAKYGEDDVKELAQRVKYKSSKHILAASKILDALTSYILLKEMVHPRGRQLIDKIDAFIEEHLNEQITVSRLCSEFSISRSRLYAAVGQFVNGGIASFVRQKRLCAAKQLVRETDVPLSEIAFRVGFNDYGYFLRVFKNTYGMSPKKMRCSITAQKS